MSTILNTLNATRGVEGIKRVCENMKSLGVKVNTIYVDENGMSWFGEATDIMLGEMDKVTNQILSKEK